MGALQVLNKPGGFTPEDVDLLGMCCAYSASALEGQRLRKEGEAAKLLLHDMEIARDVQQRLLPQAQLPIPRLEYFGYCRFRHNSSAETTTIFCPCPTAACSSPWVTFRGRASRQRC